MSEIKLAGLSAEGEKENMNFQDLKATELYCIFIRKITLQAVLKKPAILEIMLTA